MLAKVQDHEALRHRAQKFSAEAKLLVVAVVDLVRQTPVKYRSTQKEYER